MVPVINTKTITTYTNKDGKLVAKEVPKQYLIIFTRLDANSDGELTVDEARKTIDAFRKRQKSRR